MKNDSAEKEFIKLWSGWLFILVPGVVIIIGCLLVCRNQKPEVNSSTYKEKKFRRVPESLNDETISCCPTFERIQNPARFRHRINAWRKYLEKNLMYPEAAIKYNTEGVIRVQIVIEKDGSISHVIALNDLGYELAEEAVRVIKSGPRWIQARHKGKLFIYHFIQTVTFHLQ